eukprot:jgi/Ulvmu1/11580/UM079_0023.1
MFSMAPMSTLTTKCCRLPCLGMSHLHPACGGRSMTRLLFVQASSWEGPPREYSLATTCKPLTKAHVLPRYPDLKRLVDKGDLVVYIRPEDYKERRDDGYKEPEEIYIIGTSHVSQQSADDVALAIDAIRPEAVVVELCKARSARLFQDQLEGHKAEKAAGPISLSGTNLVQSFLRSISLGGPQALIVQLLLSYTLKQMLPEGQIIQPGAEFVSARQAAERAGAQVVLGDRPIEITVSRCWEALGWKRRWNLAKACLGVIAMPRTERLDAAALLASVEKMKSDNYIDKAMDQLLEMGPELVTPLVHERDLYLSWSLKRSKAVNGAHRVVGVVGKGHLKGIMWAMENDPNGIIRFSDLVGGRNTKAYKQQQRNKLVRDIVRDTVVFGALAWGIHTMGYM